MSWIYVIYNVLFIIIKCVILEIYYLCDQSYVSLRAIIKNVSIYVSKLEFERKIVGFYSNMGFHVV